MKAVIGILCCIALAGCGQSDSETRPSRFDGAVLVKVCLDGTYIYRLRDGSFQTGGLAAAIVETPETVCAAR